MRRRLLSVIIFAVLAAAVSSTLLFKIISGNSPKNVQAATAPVFVATHDLNAGTLVAEADVREVAWPVTGDSTWIGHRSDIVGRALLNPLAKGEPLSESRLAPKGSGAGIASRIPSGMRAVAVHVDELTGLSRFILPGMHVDVISTGNSGSFNNQGLTSHTILQNIEVFSTGQSAESDGKQKTPSVPVFNLLVTPKQAEVLSQAVVQTRIQLVLRNPLDTGSVLAEIPEVPRIAPIRSAALRRTPVEKKVAVAETPKILNLPPPPPPTVEIIHGTKRTVSAVAVGPELR